MSTDLNMNPNTALSAHIMGKSDDISKCYYYKVTSAKVNEFTVLSRVYNASKADITFRNRHAGKTVGSNFSRRLLTLFKQLHISAHQRVLVKVSSIGVNADLVLLFGQSVTDADTFISFDPSHASKTINKVFDANFA